MDGHSENSANDIRQQNVLRNKRRSKNDVKDRNYKGGGGKRYLSYPALYTHIKQKHDGKDPPGRFQFINSIILIKFRHLKLLIVRIKSVALEFREVQDGTIVFGLGTQSAQLKSSRGRGRPRKILIVEDNRLQQDKEYEADKKRKNDNEMKDKRFFQKFGVYGGPTDPIEWYTSDSQGGVISKISKLHAKLAEYLKKKPKPNELKADDVFCEYLDEMSSKVISKFYKIMAIFIENYRIGTNEYGWDIINEYKRVHIKEYQDKKPFTSVRTPQMLPDLANIFIQKYLPSRLPKFDRKIAIGLTKHFGDWLVRKKYSSLAIKLSED